MPSKKKAEETKLETVPAPKVDVENQDSSVEYRSKRFNSVEPLRKNGCTDIPCLILFIVCMVMWAYVGFFAMIRGEDDRILAAIDSSGRRCGFDSNLIDVPYLFIHDLSSCINVHNILIGCMSESTCVSECPEGRFEFPNNGSCTDKNLPEYINKTLCDKFVDKTKINSCNQLEEFFKNGKCAQKYVPTTSFSRICLPSNGTDIEETLNRTLLAQSFRLPILSGVKEISNKAIEQIKSEWREIVACIFASMVICLIFIFLLRWFAGPIIWVSVFGLLGVLLVGSIFSFLRYNQLQSNPVEETVHKTSLLAYVKQLLDHADTWIWIASILAVIFFVILIVVLCIFSRIRLAIEIIREGSRAVNSSVASMFFPILPLFLQCLTTTFVIYVYLNLNTLSDQMYKIKGVKEHGDTCNCNGISYKDGAVCSIDIFNKNCTDKQTGGLCEKVRCALEEVDSWEVTSYKIVNVAFGIWLTFFISSFNEIVLASVYSRWYWTYKKSKVPFCALCSGVTRTFRYHLGTIAFGSLIITICRILRLMVEYVKLQCDKYPNKFTKAILWVFRCVFWCLEKFMKFVNKNAYIMCAIRGTNFCTSARDAFTLLLQNGIRFAALHTVTAWLFFMSKLLISIGVATLVFIYVHDSGIIFPSLLVAVGTYVIADLFFGVYAMANSTMFMCALEDASQNDGSQDHPYFMSRRLSKLLVKNDDKRVSKVNKDEK